MSDLPGRGSATIQHLRRLSRRRDVRAAESVLLVDGPVLLAEALRAGVEVREVYVDEALDPALPVLERARAAGAQVTVVRSGALARALDLVTPQGVVAVVRRPDWTIGSAVASAVAAACPLLVGVEIQDPGNAGTLVRVAEAAGAAGVVLTEGSVDPWNPKAVRAAAGSSLRLPVVSGTSVEGLVDAAVAAGLPLLAAAAAPDGGSSGVAAPEDLDLSGAFAVCLGNEAHGLPAGLLDAASTHLAVPMDGQVESLNVGVAGAVIAFEAARQRRSAAGRQSGRGPIGAVGHDGRRERLG